MIIPTIMQSDPAIFNYTLMQMIYSNAVNAIFIIDNTDMQDFSKEFDDLLGCAKLHVINGQHRQLYVNNAWNLGIELAKKDMSVPYWCLLNDDILVHRRVFNHVEELMKYNEMLDVVTVNTVNDMSIDDYEDIASVSDYGTACYDEDIPNGRQGWIMFGRKNNWKPIPHQLKIFYGDDWIYDVVRKRKDAQAVIIRNLLVSHYQSSSVNPNIGKLNPIIKQDEIEWRKLKTCTLG